MYKSFFKRSIDLILCSVALVVLSPVLVITALLIKLDSKGPVIFKQERLGKKQKRFMIYKFRTMTDKERSIHKIIFKGDPDVTRIGGYLRRLKIDELPQLVNVLRGDMTIVGPRPCLPEVKSIFGKYSNQRFTVRPGLTSLAAIKGSVYLTWEEKGFWDSEYSKNISFKLDALIVLKTIGIIFKGEEALFSKRNNQ